MEKTYYEPLKLKKGKVKIEELRSAVNLLKDKSSDHLAILKNFKDLLSSSSSYFINALYDVGFFEAVRKIFQDEDYIDENVIGLVTYFIKSYGEDFRYDNNEIYNLKYLDAMDHLFKIMISNPGTDYSEECRKTMFSIGKKYPPSIFYLSVVKNIYKYINPSNSFISTDQKRTVICFFKEMMNEGIIEKGRHEAILLERVMFLGEEMEKEKNIVYITEDFMNEAKDLARIAKEKGFEENYFTNKNKLVAEYIYSEWRELYMDDDSSEDETETYIDRKEKEKAKKYTYTEDTPKEAIKDFKCFKSRMNGIFLYVFIPLFIKNYRFEKTFPLFLRSLQHHYKDLTPCYNYVALLYDEFIDRLSEEGEDIEINEEKITVLIFLWYIIKERKGDDIPYLVNLSEKVFKWLGKIEDEKEEKEGLVKEEYYYVKDVKGTVNRRELIIYKFIDIIINSLDKQPYRSSVMLYDEDRLGRLLLEIVENHLKCGRDLIKSGNKKRICEYIIYSYNKYSKTSELLLPASSHSFPFSNKTILYLLKRISSFFFDVTTKRSMKDEMLKKNLECVLNWMNLIYAFSGCNVKKEIGNDLVVEWNDKILDLLRWKIRFSWKNIERKIFIDSHKILNTLFYKENYEFTKKMFYEFFGHYVNVDYESNDSNKKNKDGNNEVIEEKIQIRPFLFDSINRTDLIKFFFRSFDDENYYSIFTFNYLMKKPEGCSILNFYMKELSGEIVDRIKEREGNNNNNNNNNIRKERRRYERERIDNVNRRILISIDNLLYFTFKNRSKAHLGEYKNKDSYKGKNKEIKKVKEYILDIIEDEDLRECLVLFLKHVDENRNKDLSLSFLSRCSESSLCILFYFKILNN